MPRAHPPDPAPLSRREREIMDIVFHRGEATVSDVQEALTDPPSYSAVRATMGTLVDKGWLSFRQEGRQYIYRPTVPRRKQSKRALRHVLDTFFADSTEDAVAALLDLRSERLDEATLARLEELIEEARRRKPGRKT